MIGVEIFDDVDAKLASALDVSPISAEMQQKIRAVVAHAASSKEVRAAIDQGAAREGHSEFQEYAMTKCAPYRNHWMGAGVTGNYTKDYRLRTSVNFAGIWAQHARRGSLFRRNTRCRREATEWPQQLRHPLPG